MKLTEPRPGKQRLRGKDPREVSPVGAASGINPDRALQRSSCPLQCLPCLVARLNRLDEFRLRWPCAVASNCRLMPDQTIDRQRSGAADQDRECHKQQRQRVFDAASRAVFLREKKTVAPVAEKQGEGDKNR